MLASTLLAAIVGTYEKPVLARSEIRILFVFDPARRAVLLVAGDKAGNWKGWYDANIPLVDKRYDEQHLGHRFAMP